MVISPVAPERVVRSVVGPADAAGGKGAVIPTAGTAVPVAAEVSAEVTVSVSASVSSIGETVPVAAEAIATGAVTTTAVTVPVAAGVVVPGAVTTAVVTVPVGVSVAVEVVPAVSVVETADSVAALSIAGCRCAPGSLQYSVSSVSRRSTLTGAGPGVNRLRSTPDKTRC